MPKITNANQLTSYALKVFRQAGFHCWRQNNGGVWDAERKAFRAGSSTKGIPDIIGFHTGTGKFLACEVKAGRDRLRPEQEQFLTSLHSAGGTALVIRHADDLKSYLTTTTP